jgi:WD40 repeat protein
VLWVRAGEGDSLRLQKVPEMGIWPLRDSTSGISTIMYSPDLRTMAVAGHDQLVHLYDCADGRYVRLKRCVGHSATISHMDWSVDSKLLQSQCNACARRRAFEPRLRCTPAASWLATPHRPS